MPGLSFLFYFKLNYNPCTFFFFGVFVETGCHVAQLGLRFTTAKDDFEIFLANSFFKKF